MPGATKIALQAGTSTVYPELEKKKKDVQTRGSENKALWVRKAGLPRRVSPAARSKARQSTLNFSFTMLICL